MRAKAVFLSGGVCRCAPLIVFVLVAGVSHAGVIDFEDNAVAAGTQITLTSDVTSGGFLFDLLTDHGHLSNAGTLSTNPWNTDNGGTYLVIDDFNGLNLLTMSPVAGGTFSLFSIDFAEWLGTLAAGANADFPATSVLVTGFLQGGGTVQKTVVMDFVNDGSGPLNDFQTELFDASWTNLTSVDFDGDGGFDSYFVIDNIVIPAPGALALLGLAGFMGTRRRRT